jgi:hypothetical protein
MTCIPFSTAPMTAVRLDSRGVHFQDMVFNSILKADMMPAGKSIHPHEPFAMPLELSQQQRQALQQQPGQPVELIDPETQQPYVLLAREQYDKVRDLLVLEGATLPPAQTTVPEGIRRSQQALRQALPELLQQPKLFRQWVAYHGEQRIGIDRDAARLLGECSRRGLAEDQYYIGWIDQSELVEEEEIELRLQHLDFGTNAGDTP